MPKVLIREWDNSTTGFPTTDNFTVVVPGYFEKDTPADLEKAREVLIDYDVYELKSQKDFDTYIGKHAGSIRGAVAPTLKVINTKESANNYTKYCKAVTPADFDRYLSPENTEYIYKAEEITDSTDDKYGKNGYLFTTIKYYERKEQQVSIDGVPQYEKKEQQVSIDGVPQYEKDGEGKDILDLPIMEWVADETKPIKEWVDDVDAGEKTVTIKLTKVDSLGDIIWNSATNGPISNYDKYCIIKEGFEGSSAIQEAHIGNQIAYELLGLGYTVLYKRLTSNDELTSSSFWAPLKDKSVFNFRYVMTGGYYNAAAMNQICALADTNRSIPLEDAETIDCSAGRGDCIALCDIDENIPGHAVSDSLTMKEAVENIGYAAKAITSNKYSAIFGPRVTYVMSDKAVEDFGRNKTFPASFHYLACAKRAFDRYNEWYAVAGYNRGVSNYSIDTTTFKLGEIAINTLAPRIKNSYTDKSINLILHERGNYYLWGNRTGEALDKKGIVFSHFLNIRQLCCSIKKQLYTACKQFTFDPNSDLLWINFVNAIKPTLEAMKADQGIKGYTITQTANDKKALLTARIRIVPIEAVEDFDISIYLEDSLTGITINTEEQA